MNVHLITFLSLVIFSSCSTIKIKNDISIQKRKHSTGWYFSFSKKDTKQQRNSSCKKAPFSTKMSPEIPIKNPPQIDHSTNNVHIDLLKKAQQNHTSATVNNKNLTLRKRSKKVEFPPNFDLEKKEDLPEKKKHSAMAITAFIFSIFSLVMVFFSPITIILASIALYQIKKHPNKFKKSSINLAKASMALGVIALALAALFIYWLILVG